MHPTNKLAFANILQFILDIVSICVTFFSAYFLVGSYTLLHSIGQYLWILIVFAPIWLSTMAFKGMYNKITFHYHDRALRNVIISTLYSGLVLASLFFFIKGEYISRLFISAFLISGIFVMFAQRCIFIMLYRTVQLDHPKTNRILIIGSPETARKFHYYLKKTNLRYHIAGYVQIGEKPPIRGKFNLGRIENLEDILKRHVVDEVVFAPPKDYTGGVEEYLRLCETMGLTVRLLVNTYDLQLSKAHIAMLGTIPMLTYHTVNLNPLQKTLKRIIDIVGAIIGLSITLIAAVFIVPAIKADSPGPVLFKQTRIGQNGRKFKIYKFRTMYIDAEERKKELLKHNQYSDGRFFKIEDDPRITNVGRFLRKTSLDELPQFFNVLAGDMSLVGTRPPTIDEVEKYEVSHWRRISIKPGITGMWQVSGRSSITDFEKIVELDSRYIDNWSVKMDISILFKTVGQVFLQKSAF